MIDDHERSKFNLNREILRLSVPAIVSNITVPLLGLCDTAISGHLGQTSSLGAIAVGSMMINVIIWLCGFLRMGTTGLTANAFGRDDVASQRGVFTLSVGLGFMLGVVFVIASVPLCELLLHITDAPGQAAGLAKEYFMICIWGAPAILATMAVSGWFVGMQSTVWPMIVAVGSNIVNICLSFILAFPVGLGFRGVAVGTLAANWIGLALALAAASRVGGGKIPWCRKGEKCGTLDYGFFKVNSNLFLRSACVMAVSLAVTSIGGRLGELTLATNAVLMQFFTLFSFFMDGFAFTGEALCGRFAGSRDSVMLRRSIRTLLLWSGGVALAFSIVYVAALDPIVALLTDVVEVRQAGAAMWPWISLLPVCAVMAFIFDGFYIGLTSTRRMLLTTMAATAVFLIIALPARDNDMLWTAFLLYLVVRGAGLAAQIRIVVRNAVA